MEPEVFIAAAVQAPPVFLDRDATVEKAVRLIEEAAHEGAKLVAFPETWIPGYPSWIYHAAEWDEPRSKRTFARLQRNAVQVPSPATDALCRAAREAGVHVVVGVHEQDTEFSMGTIYNSLLFISDEGKLLGAHRKLIPTHAERIVWGQGDGSTLHVFDTPVGRLGGLICWEHWMPLARQVLHQSGEDIHIAAWPQVKEMNLIASRHYAFEGRCFVIACGAVMRASELPAELEPIESLKQQADSFVLNGGTSIIAPDGSILAGPAFDEEAIITADLDLSRIAQESLALDVSGHYTRPDIFEVKLKS